MEVFDKKVQLYETQILNFLINYGNRRVEEMLH